MPLFRMGRITTYSASWHADETTLMHAFTKSLQMLLLIQNNRSSNRGDALMIEPVTLPPKA